MKKFSIVKDDPNAYKAIALDADNEIDALYEAINKAGYILIEEKAVGAAKSAQTHYMLTSEKIPPQIG